MSRFISKVPKFEFSSSITEQEEQLSVNPLMVSMKAARKERANDKHRPYYHFTSPGDMLNDPNGLCFWEGNWHLFYQGFPPEDPRPHWGHAVSKDLIHWRDLPYAIYPDPEECCFSGSTLVEENRVIAMYHGTQAGNMVAISSDPLLLNWEKVTGGAVIPVQEPSDEPMRYTVFDPCIWKKGDQYFSLSAGTYPEKQGGHRIAADFLFRSENLEDWEYMHTFTENDRFTLLGDDGACPYFWPLGDKYILLFYSHMSGGQYMIGDYDLDRDKFKVSSSGLFNFGASNPSGVHAPSATPDGNGGVIVIFNMNPGLPLPDSQEYQRNWNQIMTIPRQLYLDGSGSLMIEPAGDIASLRHNHRHVEEIVLPANEEILLEDVHGDAMEMSLEIDPLDSPMIELNVLRSPDREEFTRIAFFKDRGYKIQEFDERGALLQNGLKVVPPVSQPRAIVLNESVITVDTSYSSMDPAALARPPETAPFSLAENETLKLRIFVDKSVVEVFVNGKQCLSVRVYPERMDSLGVSLRSQGNSAVLCGLDAWDMESIFK